MVDSKKLKVFQRKLKKKMTISEIAFERILKDNNIKYKKQMIFGFYILDFCLPEYLLNIEIDGSSHTDKIKDMLRDRFVKKSGLSVLRIKNEDVLSYNIDNILNLNKYELKDFRSCLARANALKGNCIINNNLKVI